MTSRIALAAVFAVLASLLVAPAQARTERSTATGRYVVVLKEGVDAGAVASKQASKYGLVVDSVYRRALTGYAADVPLDKGGALRADAAGASRRLPGIMAGMVWVTAKAVKPAVANLSLGGPASDARDQAGRNSVASGVVYSVAAGNDGGSACSVSPARAGGTDGLFTVAATD